MQISMVSRARPGGVSEDYACGGADWAMVLDGATPVPGASTGCVLDVPLDGSCTAVVDGRIAQLPGDQPCTAGLVRAFRNCAGGFRVVSPDPAAARHAITGTVPTLALADAAVFSDGVSRLVDWYGYTWLTIFSLLRLAGPGRLVTLLREAECQHPLPDGEQHDDASAVYLRLAEIS